MAQVNVGPPERRDEHGKTLVSVPVDAGGRGHTVWYRVAGSSVSTGAEAQLAAALIPAMKLGGSLSIRGPVSARLLTAQETIQDILHVWCRDLNKITVEAGTAGSENGHAQQQKGVACFFSGGVDSFYSFLTHREEITDLIFLHGFDLPLEDQALRDRVAEVIRTAAARCGAHLIEVETNLKAFGSMYAPWGDYCLGTGLASVALLLAPRFRKVYIPASHSYRDLLPRGSHPLLDPLWSTETLEIVHDGCDVTRVEKTKRIARCEEALDALRVCLANRPGAYNCGRCEKCLRTMVNLRIAGVLERCQTFDRPLDLAHLSRRKIADVLGRLYAEENLRAVEAQGTDPALARALRASLVGLYHQGMRGWPRRAANRLARLTDGRPPARPRPVSPRRGAARIVRLQRQEQPAGCARSAQIVIDERPHEVWYRTADAPLGESVEPFVAAALVPAMKTSRSLEADGPISPRLLAALPVIQAMFRLWYRGFQPLDVSVQSRVGEANGRAGGARGVGCFFTAGVDSFYSLLRHQREITTLVYVHGFDLPLDQHPLRRQVSQAIRAVAAHFGKQLIEIETNLRDLTDRYTSWPRESHGAALASVAMLLSGQLKTMYLPATHTYAELFPCGSHPLLDPLWSTETLEIVHDGCEATRVEKVARIAQSGAALRYLRVCWENRDGAYNCGRCEKCLRTMISLRVAGALDRCATFDRPLDYGALSRLKLDAYKRPYFQENLEAVERGHQDPALAHGLRKLLDGTPR